MHAQADPEEGDVVLPGVTHRGDLALNAAVAETTGYQDGIHILQHTGAVALDILGVDIIDFHFREGLQTRVLQRLVEGLVGIQQVHVLTHHGHPHLAAGLAELPLQHLVPLGEVRRLTVDTEPFHHEVIQAEAAQHAGDAVNGIRVQQGDHRPLLHVGEQGNLLARALFDIHRAAAQQDIGLQANGAQLFHRVLGGFGLDLAGSGDEGDQGQVHQQCAGRTQFHFQLPCCFQKGQALDVTHRAADLHHCHIRIAGTEYHAALYLVGDMGNDLHGAPQVVTPALLAQNRIVYPAGGEVVAALHGGVREALVVTQVQVGFRPVLGDEHLAVLERAHGARVDIDVGIEFQQGHLDTPGLEHRRQRCRRDTLAQRRYHPTCDKDVTRHEKPLFTLCYRVQENAHATLTGSLNRWCESCKKMGSQVNRKPLPAQSPAASSPRCQCRHHRFSPDLAPPR